ncbi:MAG: hypothetical protein H8E19_05255 [Deltaproteobacteria bacterium]|uniref:Uncharacterized protein n=1 Tax=Candidatus Desulfacyla euxinica TaxID=2841693 RepID=A0A8J6MWE2_9DELT|nr:hypothetical protein [Candidatus Desulfacyla euxinica]
MKKENGSFLTAFTMTLVIDIYSVNVLKWHKLLLRSPCGAYDSAIKSSQNWCPDSSTGITLPIRDIRAVKAKGLISIIQKICSVVKPLNLFACEVKLIKRKGRRIKYGPMPTSPASTLGLVPSSCPILRAGGSILSKSNKITRLFFNVFSIRSSKFDWVRLGYQEYFGSLNFMKIGLEMGSTLC